MFFYHYMWQIPRRLYSPIYYTAYFLTVSSTQLGFNHTSRLNFLNKNASIFVQTDKAVYKASETG